MTQALMETKPATPLDLLRNQLEQRAAEFKMVLPSHINPQKFQRTIMTAVSDNPALLACDRGSLIVACYKAAQDHLLPDGREAAIVPFKTRRKDAQGRWDDVRLAQYMPMVAGLVKKILQSGEIRDLYAKVVYRQELEGPNPRFHYEEGANRTLRHMPILDPTFAPTDADIALAYSVAIFADGSQSYEVMRRHEIDQVRQASQTGAEGRTDRKGNAIDPKGPWVEWFAEMAKKTVIRRHSKTLPHYDDILLDVEAEDMGLAARSAVALLDRGPPADPTPLIEGGDPGVDPETGEIPPPEPDQDQPEPEPQPKRRGRPPKAQAEPPPDPEPEPDQEPPADELEAEELEADMAADPGAPAEPEAEPDLASDYGLSKTPDEIQAEDFINRAKRCENIIDFRNLEKEADMVLATMPEHIAACVDTEFDRTRRRLRPAAQDDA